MYKLFLPIISPKLYSGTPSSFVSLKAGMCKIVPANLQYDYDTIKKFMQSDKAASKIPEKSLDTNLKILLELKVNLNNKAYLSRCLSLTPKVLKNRILLLEEFGIANVSLHDIFRFRTIIRKSLRGFKKMPNISSNVDVVDNLFNSVNIKEHSFNTNALSNYYTLCEYYQISMISYREFNLEISDKKLVTKRMPSYVSFRQMSKLINVLHNKFQFNNEFISKHFYLTKLCPDSLNNFYFAFKDYEVDGVQVHDLVKIVPRVLCLETNRFKELLAILKEMNVTIHALIKEPRLISMKRSTILERYYALDNVPEIRLWLKYPRILELIIKYRQIMLRLNYLRVRNRLQYMNINTLLLKWQHLKYINNEYFGITRKKYLCYLLSKELKVPDDKFILVLMKHPHWKNISLHSIEKTIKYLKKKYTIEEIWSNIHIMFYSQCQVQLVLETLNDTFDLEEDTLTKKQELALCLYALEKSTHFSGDGVWLVAPNDKNYHDSLRYLHS